MVADMAFSQFVAGIRLFYCYVLNTPPVATCASVISTPTTPCACKVAIISREHLQASVEFHVSLVRRMRMCILFVSLLQVAGV